MTGFEITLVVISLLLLAQVSFSSYLMLYTWNDARREDEFGAPSEFAPPEKSFTVLLPARHEEEVIQHTIEGVLRANYPMGLMEIVVICRIDDEGTIAKVQEKIVELVERGVSNVRLIVFQDMPINKPHGLNIGFRHTKNEVVTIFDSEDEVHPDVFNIVNTVMVGEGVNVVQAGVQLMNFDSKWFSALNVLEYFFWFKSRLHYHAEVGIIPLGGNTIFFTRDVINRIGGWDEHCLTEDADIGIRLSQMGERIRVVYEDQYVTKEETPPTVSQFIKQRTRWNQGFLQVLQGGTYWQLSSVYQRFLAIYSLASPVLQAFTTLYIPISLYTMFFVQMPPLVAMILWLPAYMLAGQYVLNWIGLCEFVEAHGLKMPRLMWLRLLIAFYPFQILLGISALRAVYRHMKGTNNWEKTKHVNAHRGASA
ncbi:MAG TPA: glycosyltransferase [Chloroflexaceae bacterium]|nr:glycosyltransferase [Chloroflexaceae bacterium]